MCIPVPCALTFTIWRTVNGSPAFVEYILSDGLILPEGCEAPTAQTCKDGTDDSWSDFSGSDSDEDDAEEVDLVPEVDIERVQCVVVTSFAIEGVAPSAT